jgi:hypothetical protein
VDQRVSIVVDEAGDGLVGPPGHLRGLLVDQAVGVDLVVGLGMHAPFLPATLLELEDADLTFYWPPPRVLAELRRTVLLPGLLLVDQIQLGILLRKQILAGERVIVDTDLERIGGSMVLARVLAGLQLNRDAFRSADVRVRQLNDGFWLFSPL